MQNFSISFRMEAVQTSAPHLTDFEQYVIRDAFLNCVQTEDINTGLTTLIFHFREHEQILSNQEHSRRILFPAFLYLWYQNPEFRFNTANTKAYYQIRS
jgi:hypothetical protein